jgi:hypothetical protein
MANKIEFIRFPNESCGHPLSYSQVQLSVDLQISAKFLDTYLFRISSHNMAGKSFNIGILRELAGLHYCFSLMYNKR